MTAPGDRWTDTRNLLMDDFSTQWPTEKVLNHASSWAAYIVGLEERAARLPRDAIKLVCRCGHAYDPIGTHAATCPAFDLSPLFAEEGRT